MALPIFYPFKTRYLTATTSSSNSSNMSVAVPARGKLVGGIYATTPLTAHTAAANEFAMVLNGTAISGSTAIAITTSTGDSATVIPPPTSTIYVKQGDVLSTFLSSCTGGTMTFIVQEF